MPHARCVLSSPDSSYLPHPVSVAPLTCRPPAGGADGRRRAHERCRSQRCSLLPPLPLNPAARIPTCVPLHLAAPIAAGGADASSGAHQGRLARQCPRVQPNAWVGEPPTTATSGAVPPQAAGSHRGPGALCARRELRHPQRAHSGL
ncbi:unnamed protein product [Closterium sp. NIES-53]